MNAQFEDFQKLGKENFELALKTLDTHSKGMQAIATEVADYTKKSPPFPGCSAHGQAAV